MSRSPARPKACPPTHARALVQIAGALGLARLSINGAVEMERIAPCCASAHADVTPPPGGFLQACAESEAAMLELVQEAVGDARRVVDLFAGAGTFTLPLAALATVHAVESEEAALAALERAARKTPGIKPVTTEKRDLFRRPLTRARPQALRRRRDRPAARRRRSPDARTRRSSSSASPWSPATRTTFARDLKILMLDAGWRRDAHHAGRPVPLVRPYRDRRRAPK